MRIPIFKKLVLSTVLGVAGLAASATASAVVVGGVDFGAGGSHLETTTLAETFINDNGQNLQGYGQVNTVNGNLLYAGANRLYFTFTGYQSTNFSPLGVDFTGGTIGLYLLPSFNLLNQSSAANIGLIQAGSAWATLGGRPDSLGYTIRSNGILTGATLAFTGSGLLDVTGGLADVVSYLDVNDIFDGVAGFADISFTTSGNNGGTSGAGLNRFDDRTGCATGTAQPGQWCIAGSADLRGSVNVVPEPGSLALVGVALLGLVGLRKRKAV